MSKYAIISDIHGNFDALELVLKDIEKRNVDKIICLGDLVSKYSYPAEVIDSIKANCEVVLKGNCDYFTVTADNTNFKNIRDNIGLDRTDYLAELPLTEQLKINKVLLSLYHASPDNIEKIFNPLFDDNKNTKYKDLVVNDYNDMFIGKQPQIVFVGHTHQNYIGVEENNNLQIKNDSVILSDNDKAIINVGSAGQHTILVPNETKTGYNQLIDPFLTYAIIDDEKLDSKLNVKIIKVPYKDTLKKVYFDSLESKDKGETLTTSAVINTMKNSLINMGELENDEPKKL